MEEPEITSLELLQFLKKNGGLHKKISISNLIDQWYPTPLLFYETQFKLTPLYRLIGTLELEGFIKNVDKPNPNGNTYTWNVQKNFQMALTIAGDEYLKDNLHKEAEFEVNKLTIDSHDLTEMVHKSVIDTNRKMIEISKEQAISNDIIATNSRRQADFSKFQTWIAAFTGLFILCTLAATVYGMWRDNRIESLGLKLRQRDSTIRKEKTNIDLLKSDTARLGLQVRTLKKSEDFFHSFTGLS
ncbi:hypothetical protein [Mucilaginibacter sp. BT774]|uniref:hypothetical protein n=1 Tax=Mucilaginibacter sp. BT774 TaxID=3062276 RepID=UPI002675DF81|nr:hypothetical protein [Mucilaginibacter sp. BT774]MDO3627117.1 hypothetical protein [Mucilaginibacter sp. BT774]